MNVQSASTAAQAPGCFGSPSVYSVDSSVCAACASYNTCRVASHATLEKIRGTINVSDVLARHAKARLAAITDSAIKYPVDNAPPLAAQPKPIRDKVVRNTPVARVVFDVSANHEQIISTLAVKTGELARQQLKQNRLSAIAPALKQGLNPYAESGPKFLRIACDLLLKGGFTRTSLNRAMVSEFAWQETTAGPHVAQVCGLFNAFDITQETNGTFTPKPA
ncbi:hypothetical protein LP414_27195 [Polaromonas sp. P1(28)-13]|nr:hypothetical protein LP414_27195 [Polaromonas sp. P1(28)-13]